MQPTTDKNNSGGFEKLVINKRHFTYLGISKMGFTFKYL